MSNDEFEQRPSRWLWGLAALAALALHLGGAALAVAHLRGTDTDDGLGANGVEIAFEMASPKVTDDQLPPGPDTDASMASPQLAEQKAEVKETELRRTSRTRRKPRTASSPRTSRRSRRRTIPRSRRCRLKPQPSRSRRKQPRGRRWMRRRPRR